MWSDFSLNRAQGVAADHVADWQPRILLGMVEAPSVTVKKTTVLYNIVLVDLSPTLYRLPKPLLVHGSMLLLSTLILSSYSIIVVMLG